MSYALQIKKNSQTVTTMPKSMIKPKDWEYGQNLDWKLNNKDNLKLAEKND